VASLSTVGNSDKEREQAFVSKMKSTLEVVSSGMTKTRNPLGTKEDIISGTAWGSTPGESPRALKHKKRRVLRQRISKSEPRRFGERGSDCAYGPISAFTEPEALARQMSLQNTTPAGDSALVDQRCYLRNHNWQCKGGKSNTQTITDSTESLYSSNRSDPPGVPHQVNNYVQDFVDHQQAVAASSCKNKILPSSRP